MSLGRNEFENFLTPSMGSLLYRTKLRKYDTVVSAFIPRLFVIWKVPMTSFWAEMIEPFSEKNWPFETLYWSANQKYFSNQPDVVEFLKYFERCLKDGWFPTTRNVWKTKKNDPSCWSRTFELSRWRTDWNDTVDWTAMHHGKCTFFQLRAKCWNASSGKTNIRMQIMKTIWTKDSQIINWNSLFLNQTLQTPQKIVICTPL